MKSFRLRYLIIGLPILSFIVATSSVAIQYSKLARVKTELKSAEAEIHKLDPKAVDTEDPEHSTSLIINVKNGDQNIFS